MWKPVQGSLCYKSGLALQNMLLEEHMRCASFVLVLKEGKMSPQSFIQQHRLQASVDVRDDNCVFKPALQVREGYQEVTWAFSKCKFTAHISLLGFTGIFV